MMLLPICVHPPYMGVKGGAIARVANLEAEVARSRRCRPIWLTIRGQKVGLQQASRVMARHAPAGSHAPRTLLVAVTFTLARLLAAPPPDAPAPTANAPALPPAAPQASAAPLTGHAPKAPVALEEYFKIRRVSGASFSHDEKLVAYMSDEGGRPDVWVAAGRWRPGARSSRTSAASCTRSRSHPPAIGSCTRRTTAATSCRTSSSPTRRATRRRT